MSVTVNLLSVGLSVSYFVGPIFIHVDYGIQQNVFLGGGAKLPHLLTIKVFLVQPKGFTTSIKCRPSVMPFTYVLRAPVQS